MASSGAAAPATAGSTAAMTAAEPAPTTRQSSAYSISIRGNKPVPATDPSTKPKQTKSRNGCHTCKKKRLKCDEKRPSCDNCTKRNVDCGGYKKTFQWRSFEDQQAQKPLSRAPKKAVSNRIDKANRRSSPQRHDSQHTSTSAPPHTAANTTKTTTSSSPYRLSPVHSQSSLVDETGENLANHLKACLAQSSDAAAKPAMSASHTDDHAFVEPDPVELNLDDFENRAEKTSHSDHLDPFFEMFMFEMDDCNNARPATAPGKSGKADKNTSPAELYAGMDQLELARDGDHLSDQEQQHLSHENLLQSTLFSNWGTHSLTSDWGSMDGDSPKVEISDEWLIQQFEGRTCMILSICNGPRENPWHSHIVPLLDREPVLFHAVAAMAALHNSTFSQAMKERGVKHMNLSINMLKRDLQVLSPEVALATAIALAFAESWDLGTTGLEHIRAAKALLPQAHAQLKSRPGKDRLERFKFLARTWVYLDVIARLTSVDDDESDDFARLTEMLSLSPSSSLDPLMGCASSLFPIIGCTANLIRRVCKADSNSPSVISRARELEGALKRWSVPRQFKVAPDADMEVQHCRQMAEAYRWTTLLYLYQAVPELPSVPASKLGTKVLKLLATVGPEDGVSIVQIYPLLAAGCEATSTEDREWVRQRWDDMKHRMWIVNLDRCRDVVEEVWRRRDRWAHALVNGWAAMDPEQQRGLQDEWDLMANLECNVLLDDESRRLIMSSRNIHRPQRRSWPNATDDEIEGSMERAFTVRGELHWVGVMKDLNLEILLG